MKNPFIAAAMLVAAMAATAREQAYKRFGMSPPITGKSRIAGKRNPPGSKMAKKIMKVRGIEWDGERIDTRSLTELNNERARKRLGL